MLTHLSLWGFYRLDLTSWSALNQPKFFHFFPPCPCSCTCAPCAAVLSPVSWSVTNKEISIWLILLEINSGMSSNIQSWMKGMWKAAWWRCPNQECARTEGSTHSAKIAPQILKSGNSHKSVTQIHDTLYNLHRNHFIKHNLWMYIIHSFYYRPVSWCAKTEKYYFMQCI